MRYDNKQDRMIPIVNGDERPKIEIGRLGMNMNNVFQQLNKSPDFTIIINNKHTNIQLKCFTPLSIDNQTYETSDGKTIFDVGLTLKWQTEWKSITNQKFSFFIVLHLISNICNTKSVAKETVSFL